MKKFLFIIALVSLAACATHKSAQTSRFRPAELKVISYNVRNSRANDGDNDWKYRRPATIAMLQEQRPDIFGVQEAYPEQISFINENMPVYKCVGVGRDDGIEEGEHMSIFYDTTRISITSWGTYWLSETPSVPSFGWGAACRRTATWAKLRLIPSGKEFFYVNTHLDHVSPLARKNGLALIVTEIGKMNPAGLPMILTGDFNIPPSSDNLTDLNKIMYSARVEAEQKDGRGSFNGWGKYGNSPDAPTWDGPVENCPMMIDYIYYSGFAKCPQFIVLDKKYVGVPYISDHYPIAAVLQF